MKFNKIMFFIVLTYLIFLLGIKLGRNHKEIKQQNIIKKDTIIVNRWFPIETQGKLTKADAG